MILSANKKMGLYAFLDALFLAVCAYFLWFHAGVPDVIPKIGVAVGILIEMFLGVKGFVAPTIPPQE